MLIRKSYNIEKRIMEEVDEIRFEQRYKNESDVVRDALKIGLEELKKRVTKNGKLKNSEA